MPGGSQVREGAGGQALEELEASWKGAESYNRSRKGEQYGEFSWPSSSSMG